MLTRIPSRLETIIPLVKAEVALLFDSTRIFCALVDDRDLMLRAPADRFLAIKPHMFPIDEGVVTGGGNDGLWVDGEWEITLFLRYAVDVDYADDAWLTDPTSGVLPLWSQMITALQLFDPLDGSGNAVLAEPMRLAAPGWRNMPTSRGKVGTWGRLKSYWEVKYLHVV